MLVLLGYLSTTRGRPAIFIVTYTYIVFMQEHCFIFKLNSVSSTVAILRFIVSIVLNDYKWTVLTVFIGHWEHTTTIRGQKIYNQLSFFAWRSKMTYPVSTVSLLIIINDQVQAMRETGISAIAFTLPAAEPWVDRQTDR